MGYDFMGHGGVSLDGVSWVGCFQLAIAFGWCPAGTLAPTLEGPWEGEWEGGYFSNSWQEVTKDDARALGLALQKALVVLRSGEELTKEQGEAFGQTTISAISEFSDYALSGGFLIG